MQHTLSILLSSLTLLSACDKPNCEVTNPIFAQYSPESIEYQDELVRLLEESNPEKLSYWFDEYVVLEGQEYLKVSVRGSEICAEGILAVEKWDDKIKGIKRTRGESYRGAELRGLTFNIEYDTGNPILVYNNLDRIID